MKPLIVATLVALAPLAASAQCLPLAATAATPQADPAVLLRTGLRTRTAQPPAPPPPAAGDTWQPLLAGLAIMAGIALRRRGP